MNAAAENPLSPYYYRDNFVRLYRSVREQYDDVLSAREKIFLNTFDALPFQAQCLYVRLAMRSVACFRESRISYSEIASTEDALDALMHSKLAEEVVSITPEEAAQVFVRPELHAALPQGWNLPPRTSKSALIQRLTDESPSGTVLVAWLRDIEPGRLFRLRGLDVIELLQLLFFTNRRQRLSEFILEDLGVMTWYPYTVSHNERFFSGRSAVDEYLRYAHFSDCFYDYRDNADCEKILALAAIIMKDRPVFSSSLYRWSRVCNRVARELERMDRHDFALAIYARSERHPARSRSALILERLDRVQEALSLCSDIRREPWCEEEREASERVEYRLRRKCGEQLPRRRKAQHRTLSIAVPHCTQSVEESAARALTAQWTSVSYVENALMNTLFGLAFWDVIFAPVKGAFSHGYQSVPNDMYDRSFRKTRETLIKKQLGKLAALDLAQFLPDTYRRCSGFRCQWINSRRVSEELVSSASHIIPAEHLMAIWERILFDPAQNRRGFPDLLALGTATGDYCMVEVKGPGDTLQDNQKRWLSFFDSNNIPAAVARVDWRDA